MGAKARVAGRTILVALVLLPALGGCGAMQSFLQNRPTAEITGVKLQDLRLDSVTLAFEVEIGNPYSVPLPLVNLDYSLASNGTAFLSGKTDMQGTVPAGGRKTVLLPAKVIYLELLKVLTQVRPGAVIPYAAEMGMSVDAPGVGPLRLPIRKEGQLPIPAPPEVAVSHVQWSKLALDDAGGTFHVNIVNRNRFAMDLSKFDYRLSLAGTEVAASTVAKAVPFAADGGQGTIEIPVKISPKNVGLAFFRMLTGEGAGYSLRGEMVVSTPFGPATLAVDKSGNTVFKK